MKDQTKWETYKIIPFPTWACSLAVNGEDGEEEDDVKAYREFEKRLNEEIEEALKKEGKKLIGVFFEWVPGDDWDDAVYFCANPAFGKPTEVVDTKVEICYEPIN